MRKLTCTALLLAAACGGAEPEQVQIRFHLAEEECDEPCGKDHREDAMIVESDAPAADDLYAGPDQLLLFSDFDVPGGALGVLELAVASNGASRVRYRELEGGRALFRGRVTSQRVWLQRFEGTAMMSGRFELTAEDDEGNRRVVTDGRVGDDVFTPVAMPPASMPPSSTPSGNGGGGGSVTVIVDGRRVPPPPVHVDSGCDDSTSSSSCGDANTSSGCDDSSSSSGCDSSSSSSGCDDASSASSGCEGDTASSGCDGGGGGCDGGGGGCDGDVAKGCSAMPRGHGRVAGSVWRILWPIALVLWANRRMKRGRA